MQTINIKGKEYVTVNERIKAFRSEPQFKGWSIDTSILELNDDRVVMKCEIRNDIGEIKSSGLAYEMQASSYINKTSYIENCETSAVGRALGFLGVGIDATMCSADELATALINQGTKAVVNEHNDAADAIPDEELAPDMGKYVQNLVTKYSKILKTTDQKLSDWVIKKFGADVTKYDQKELNAAFDELKHKREEKDDKANVQQG